MSNQDDEPTLKNIPFDATKLVPDYWRPAKLAGIEAISHIRPDVVLALHRRGKFFLLCHYHPKDRKWTVLAESVREAGTRKTTFVLWMSGHGMLTEDEITQAGQLVDSLREFLL